MIPDEKKLIRDSIVKLTKEGKLGDFSPKEIPEEIPFQYVMAHGDSTTIAFPIAKRIGKDPQEIALQISATASDLGGVEVKPVNGYINFPISKERLLEVSRKAVR